MVNLVLQLREDIIDSRTDLASVLRRAKVLAVNLQYKEFEEWVDYELNGYINVDVAPDYRYVTPRNIGHLLGPFGAQIRNAPIPPLVLPNLVRKHAEKVCLRQGVHALEILLKDNLQIVARWPENYIAASSNCFEGGYVLVDAWQEFTKGQIEQILDTIRNKLLNFILELEKRYPDVVKSDEAIANIPKEQTAGIFTANIYGSGNTVLVHNPESENPIKPIFIKAHSPWISGSFYLFTAITVLVAIAVIGKMLPGYTLLFVIIVGVPVIAIIGALQLRNDNRLKDKSFIKLIMEVFKYIPHLSQLWNPKQTELLETPKQEIQITSSENKLE